MKKSSIYLSFFLFTCTLSAQDFMLQGWYWDYPKMPANCGNAAQTWADVLNGQATAIDSGGFTYLWLPPLSRASFGNCSNGYDPKDLYDLGEYSLGATGFGTRTDVDDLIATLNSLGINPVADVVYNHRDGGKPEINGAVEGWIENMTCTKINNGDNAFPSDRFRCYLPLGGASGNGAGDYYFKIRSASKHSNFFGKQYKVYMNTNVVGWQNLTDLNEAEPNGGGDCGQSPDATSIQLGRNLVASIDNVGASCSGFCGIDEFKLTLTSGDFNAAGDTLYIYLANTNGNYSDHYVYGLWSAPRSLNIQNEIKYQTYTDFTSMPSGQGSMNYLNFKPNGAPTQLNGDWDWLWFFYDYDQNVASTRTTLFNWSKWLWNSVGIRGYRMDAVKHFDHAFVGDLLDDLDDEATPIHPGMVVGEFFDTNPFVLKGWVDNVQASMNASTLANVDVRAFDFGLRQALKNACDQFGYDVRNVFQSGMVDAAGASGFEAISFVNNHDYRGPGEPVQNTPMLAYAYILTNNQVGMPCVFYPEYFGVQPPNYPNVNLKTSIDELMGIHSAYIFGSTHRDYLSRFSTPFSQSFTSGFPNTTLFYQLAGGAAGKDVLVCINFAGEPLNMTHGVNGNLDGVGGNNFNVGDHFLDLTGNATVAEVTVNSGFTVNMQIPARSYAVFAECDLLTFFEDGDDDGYGNELTTVSACVAPAGYVANATDCDDTDETIYPGATETCNLQDDDCDTQVDEGVQSTFYADTDTDTYGNAGSSTLGCTAPSGYVSNDDDCNDGNAAIYPGAPETCNSLDDDCDTQVDEGLFTTLTSPLNGATNVPATTALSWAAAPGAPLGYRLDVGTTPGGTEILNNFDAGNVLTYDPPGYLPANSLIYVQIKPYYTVGGNPDGCGEESFTTKVCIADLTLENLTIPTGNYHSEGALISNLATVANGSNVLFKSDTSVSLEHDFAVDLGGLFEAIIEVCPN